jgi:hypothetical protein
MVIFVLVYFLMGLSPRTPISPEDYKNTKEYLDALSAKGLDKPIYTRF